MVQMMNMVNPMYGQVNPMMAQPIIMVVPQMPMAPQMQQSPIMSQMPVMPIPQPYYYAYPQAPVYSYPSNNQQQVCYPQMVQVQQMPVQMPMNEGSHKHCECGCECGCEHEKELKPTIQPAPVFDANNEQTQNVNKQTEVQTTVKTKKEPVIIPADIDVIAPVVEGTVNVLKEGSIAERKALMEGIADVCTNNPNNAIQFLDKRVMEGLLTILAEDTNNISNEETKKAAEENKQYALYTISFLQNLLVNETEKRNGIKLKLEELPGTEQVVMNAKANPNPEVRSAALAALINLAKPEDSEILKTIFSVATTDASQEVRTVAEIGLAKVS